MAAAPIEAASLVYSTDALKYRAAKAGLSTEDDAIINNNVKSLAQLAFAIRPPGTSPSDDAVKDFFSNQVAVNLATITGLKLLIFEAHTLVVANIKSEISKKDHSSSTNFLPPAERGRRVKEQHERLQGLRFRGDEECAHSNYDLVFSMMERDNLICLPREKFVTRRFELQQRKPGKEIILDQNALTVKDKQSEYTCSTRTELELFQAMRRRALTSDLVGLCRYEVFNSYHSELLQHLQEEPAPGYTKTSLIQLLRADRAAFLHIAEQISTLKRDSAGELPLEKHLPLVLSKPTVTFHLLPLASSTSSAGKPNPQPKSISMKRKHSEERHEDPPKPSPRKGKGKGKGKSKRNEDEVQTSQKSSSAKPWKAPIDNAFAGLSA